VTEGKNVPEGLTDLYVYYRPNSRVAEAARSVRTNLLFMRPDKPLHTLLVTSAHPREGKTSTSATLAITLAAASGRCILVDTDLRKPRLHKVFGIPNIGGVTGYILGREPVTNFVQPTQVPGLDFMPCGALPPNPSEILHTQRFKEMVDELKLHYTTVVFDSPPIEIVADALVVAALVDGVVLVAHTAKSRHDWVASALAHLRSVNAPLMGIVLSRTGIQGVGYGYYYGKGYRKGGAYKARYQYRYRYGAVEEQDQLEAAHFAQPGGARVERDGDSMPVATPPNLREDPPDV
jgi:capsular exopolysaccharide synthesis family protein